MSAEDLVNAWFVKHDDTLRMLGEDLREELSRVYENHLKRSKNCLGDNSLTLRFAVASGVDQVAPFLLGQIKAHSVALGTYNTHWRKLFEECPEKS